MLYKILDKSLIIKDVVKDTTYSLDISMFNKITSFVADKAGEYIAFIVPGEKREDSSLFIHKLGSTNCNEIYKGKVSDLVWFNDKSILLFNSGNTICMIQSNGSNYQKLLKISKIDYSPIMLSLSPDEAKIAFIKWKSDNKRLFIYDIIKKEVRDLSLSCFNYCWLDDRTIAYNLSGGIKTIDIIENKVKTLIKDVISLRKLDNYGKECEEIEKVLKDGESQGLIVNDVAEPKYVYGKIFFHILACTKTSKVVGLLSVNKDLSNLCQHFISDQGLINDYNIISEDTIAVDIKKQFNKRNY